MAIAGIETGGGLESLMHGFSESPFHVRDINPTPQSNLFNFPGVQSQGTVLSQNLGSPPPLNPFLNGQYAVLPAFSTITLGQSNVVPVTLTFGNNWTPLTQTQFTGQLPIGGDDGSIAWYAAQWGTDVSIKFFFQVLLQPGRWAGACAFSFQDDSGQPNFQLSGNVTFQIISADLKQTIDVTPGGQLKSNLGTTAITFDSVALFGRSTWFFIQAKMSNQNNPNLVPNSRTPDPAIFFGPYINISLQ